LCGSDLHWFQDGAIGDATVARPLALGHEIGGVIASGPRAGTRVAVDPADPCERCEACVAGVANLCEALRFAGPGTTDGALRESMAWPSRLLVPVPDGIADAEVPLLEPLGVALHALDLGHVRGARHAAVIGCGPIGLLLVGALRAAGVPRVVASDPLAHRRDAAARAGATLVAATAADGSAPELAGSRVDVAFETAGEDAAVGTALAVVRPGGRVVLVGIPSDDRTTFRASLARRKGLTLVLSRRMQARHLARAAALVASGSVVLDGLVSGRVPLAEAPAAFAALERRDGLKLVVEPAR
jgi:L-iditol 2-dehydrogenase